MLTELSAAQAVDRAGREIAAQLRWEQGQRALRNPSVLTDDDLEFIEFTTGELKRLGSHAALFGEPAEYPKSASYMSAYRRRQRLMAEAGEGPRCPLSAAPKEDRGSGRFACWSTSYQCADEAV